MVSLFLLMLVKIHSFIVRVKERAYVFTPVEKEYLFMFLSPKWRKAGPQDETTHTVLTPFSRLSLLVFV